MFPDHAAFLHAHAARHGLGEPFARRIADLTRREERGALGGADADELEAMEAELNAAVHAARAAYDAAQRAAAADVHRALGRAGVKDHYRALRDVRGGVPAASLAHTSTEERNLLRAL